MRILVVTLRRRQGKDSRCGRHAPVRSAWCAPRSKSSVVVARSAVAAAHAVHELKVWWHPRALSTRLRGERESTEASRPRVVGRPPSGAPRQGAFGTGPRREPTDAQVGAVHCLRRRRSSGLASPQITVRRTHRSHGSSVQIAAMGASRRSGRRLRSNPPPPRRSALASSSHPAPASSERSVGGRS